MKHLSAITKTAPTDSGVDQVDTEHHWIIIGTSFVRVPRNDYKVNKFFTQPEINMSNEK